jgi:hypothetical protein
MFGLLGEYISHKAKLRRGISEYARNGWQSPLIYCMKTRSPFKSWKKCLEKAFQGIKRSSRRR